MSTNIIAVSILAAILDFKQFRCSNPIWSLEMKSLGFKQFIKYIWFNQISKRINRMQMLYELPAIFKRTSFCHRDIFNDIAIKT